MYKLYYMPGACSLAVHVALIETGAKFSLENVKVPEGQPRSAEFLAINPRGNVPVLQKGDFVLREGVAILLHILDNCENDLLAKSGQQRDITLEWLAFANASLHPTYSRVFAMHRVLKNDAANNAMYEPSIALIQKHWDDIENHLQNKNFVCGEKCTIADILITVIANWSFGFAKPIIFGEKTKALFAKVIERPSYKEALEVEKIKYRAA